VPKALRPIDHWPTGAKLLLLLTAALLPLGLILAWGARDQFRDSERASSARAEEEAIVAARSVERLIARNALALRIAANGALRDNPADPCGAAVRSLALTPAIVERFGIRNDAGEVLCVHGDFIPVRNDTHVAPGAIRLWISPIAKRVYYRVGVVGGTATGYLSARQVEAEVRDLAPETKGLKIRDRDDAIAVFGPAQAPATNGWHWTEVPIGNRQLIVSSLTAGAAPTFRSWLVIMLPLLVFLLGTVLSYLFVRRLLLVPLERLQRVVNDYRPGETLVLPERIGSAEEIRSLGHAFERAVDRIEQSEAQMAEALEGQRRLVREVHHRVKNNLQVIASLLSIHGRNAATPESRAAYAAMGRRVDALSVVHRNHFAEGEDSRGIALRPLLVELAATLRASAPESSRTLAIQLDCDNVYTTQDAAVAVAFFATEVVEFAMLRTPGEPIDIELRRMSELAANLTVSSNALVDEEQRSPQREQFDRVIRGLARQLRSPLEEKVGRVAVHLPVFPER
jgi:two-component sensor histidine kinase